MCISNTICFVCVGDCMLDNQPERQRQERQRKDIQKDVQICGGMKDDSEVDGWMGVWVSGCRNKMLE